MSAAIIAFRLPLELCPPQNRTRGAAARALGRLKKNCWDAMLTQYMRQMGKFPPSPGECGEEFAKKVVCTRHSSTEPDRWSDWAKVPIDLLCVPRARRRRGLCLIFDDAPKHVEIEQRWERAPRGAGYCTIEVFE